MSSKSEDDKIFDLAWNLYHTTPYSVKDCMNAVKKCGLGKDEQEYIDFLKLHNSKDDQ